MDDYRRRQIAAAAEAEVKAAGIMSLPVCPKLIAERAGITVMAAPADHVGASGWLVRAGDNFGILYGTHIDNEGFQSFSIAHELGHYFLDGHPAHVFRDGERHASSAGFGSKDPVEVEADCFAASLLMPSSLFRPAMNKFRDGLAAIQGLKGLTKASLEATAIRYAEQTSAAIAVVLSEGGSVLYSVLSDEMKEHRARRLTRGTTMPRRCITRTIAGDLAAGVVNDEIKADEWFDGMRGTFTEEAIHLGTYGRTLTILTLDIDSTDEDAPAWNPRFRK